MICSHGPAGRKSTCTCTCVYQSIINIIRSLTASPSTTTSFHAMAENLPPTNGTAAATATTAPDQPGRPYYESLRTTLRGTLTKKRQIDEQLAALEENIYKLETSYLEDTSGAGNIVRGFDNWVKGVVIGNDRRGDDRKARTRVRDEDRIFSNSSMTWIKVRRYALPRAAARADAVLPAVAGASQ